MPDKQSKGHCLPPPPLSMRMLSCDMTRLQADAVPTLGCCCSFLHGVSRQHKLLVRTCCAQLLPQG